MRRWPGRRCRHRSGSRRRPASLLSLALLLDDVVDAFQYRGGRDLTGYEDGTENPEGEDAAAAAIVRDARQGLDGSSFAAVQRWVHDLDRFTDLPQQARSARRPSAN